MSWMDVPGDKLLEPLVDMVRLYLRITKRVAYLYGVIMHDGEMLGEYERSLYNTRRSRVFYGRLEEKRQQHDRRMAELRERQEEHERRLWEEKLDAELHMTQKRMELEKSVREKSVRETTAKLPKLKITPFKGTPTNWVRFEKIFSTQVHEKPITDGEKFRYVLVCQKVRDKLANLKPGKVGYQTVWDRLRKVYGQTKLVVNSHVREIVK